MQPTRLISLLLPLLFTVAAAHAQRLRFHPMHHEFALLPVGMGQVQALAANPSEITAYRHQAYGLYKYHFNKYQAVRGGIGYEAAREVMDKVGYQHTNVALLRVGYEHKLPLGRFQLYAGAELAYALGQRNLETLTDLGLTPAAASVSEARIQGFAGLRFFATKHLSFNIENTVFKPLGATNTDLAANWLQAGVSLHGKKMKKKCTCGKPGS